MSRQLPGAVGVLAALAICAGLAACAGSGASLPQCRGKAVPINSPAAAAAVAVAQGSAADAH
jgi:hypothetical protein